MSDLTFSVADAAKATNCATKDCALGGEIDSGDLRVTVTRYNSEGKKHLSHSHAICFLTKTAPRARYAFNLDDLGGFDELGEDVQALLTGYMDEGEETEAEDQTTPAKPAAKATKKAKAKGGKGGAKPAASRAHKAKARA